MRRIFFISVPYFYNFKSDGGGSSTDQWVIIVEIFRHAPNARPEAVWAASGASAGAAVAGPVEIFRHVPNATAGAVGVSGCSRAQWRTQCHDRHRARCQAHRLATRKIP